MNAKDKSLFFEQQNQLSNVKNVIGVVSGKGGVGKSLVTSLLASEMNKKGYKTAILDADITGPSIPKSFGVKGPLMAYKTGTYPAVSKNGVKICSANLLLENETDPVVWRGPVVSGAIKQFWQDIVWEEVDYMFVDMPPGTGDVALTVFQSLPLKGIVIVTSPQDLVSMIVDKAVNMANKMDVPIIGLVENMSYFTCTDCGKKHHIFGESKAEQVASERKLNLLAQIPINPEIASQVDKGLVEDLDAHFMDGAIDSLVEFTKEK